MPSGFLKIETGAVALAPAIHAAIGACLQTGAKNIFFLGTGGAAILMQPAALLLQRRSSFPAYMEIAAEFVAGGPSGAGPQFDRRHSVAVGHHEGIGRDAGILQGEGRHHHLAGRPQGYAAGPEGRPCLRQFRRGRHLVRVLLSAVAVHRAVGHGASRRVSRTMTRPSPNWQTCRSILLAAKQAFEPRPNGWLRPSP